MMTMPGMGMGTMLPPTALRSAGMGAGMSMMDGMMPMTMMNPGAVMPPTTMLNAPLGTSVRLQGQQFYGSRHAEDPRFMSLWERDPSLKSFASGSSAEREPLKGTASTDPDRLPPKLETSPLHYALWFFSFVTVATAGFLMYFVWDILHSNKFIVYSRLSYDVWFPSEEEFMYVFVAMAVLAVICCALGSLGAVGMQKQLLKAVTGSAGSFGLLLLVLVGVCYYLKEAATSDVVRVINVICQDTSVWCGRGEASTPASVTATATGTGIEAAAGGVNGDTPLPVRRLDVSLNGTTSANFRYFSGVPPFSAVAAIGRRLVGSEDSSAQAALQYDEHLYTQLGHNVDLLCQHVEEMCVQPLHFDVTSACVCSGQWDFASPSVSILPGTRRLDGVNTVAPGPWKGSIGAYCGAWDANVGDPLEWCFVYQTAQCAGYVASDYETSENQVYYRSGGPCTDEVESRSEYVLDGKALMTFPLATAGALGLLLILLASVAFSLTKLNPKGASKRGRVDPKPGAFVPATLQKQFEDAQRAAVMRLRNHTPESTKLQLYALYKQAKVGPINQPRPNGFLNGYELRKWTAWANMNDMSREEAIMHYIEAVKYLDDY